MQSLLPGLLVLIICFQSLALSSQSLDSKVDSILSLAAQEPTDSLRIRKIMLYWQEIRDQQPALSKKVLHAAFEEARKVNSAWGIAFVEYNQGFVYTLEGKDSLARACYHRSLDYFESVQDTAYVLNIVSNLINLDYGAGKYEQVIEFCDSIVAQFPYSKYRSQVTGFRTLNGLSQYFLGNNLLAMQQFILAVDYFEQAGDSSRLADNLVFLGYTQDKLKKFEKAEEYYKEAIAIYSVLNDQFFLAQAQNELGILYLETGQWDKAEQYLRRSLKINEANQFTNMGVNLLNLGRLFVEKKRYEAGVQYFQQALARFEDGNDIRNQIDTYANWGHMHFEKKQYQQALSMFKKAETLLQDYAYPDGEKNIYQPIAEALAAMGAWRESALYSQKYIAINDSLYEKESVRQQNELLAFYETEKKEKALLLEKQENESLRQEAEIKNLQLHTLWIAGLFLLGMGGFAFVIFRQKALRKQLIQENENKALEKELEFKRRELSTHALHLVSKNKLLAELRDAIEKMKSASDNKRPFVNLIGSIDHDLRGDDDWENFQRYFRQVHSDFDIKIKQAFSELTGNEIRLVTLMKMNLSTKEIATILNISPESVKKARYRLRKKLNLNTDQNLQQFILAL